VVENGQSFVAVVNIQPGVMNHNHTIELLVHPQWRGHLERPLIGRALHYLSRWPNQEIFIKHPAEHPEAIAAYQEFGFAHEQTLIWMKQEM
jgi:hypothetical protein